MFKRGEWSLTTIAAFILVLVVLVLLIIAFREQFAKLFGSFSNIVNQANNSGGSELVKEAIKVPAK